MQYYHAGDGSTSNKLGLGFYSKDYIIYVTADNVTHTAGEFNSGGTIKQNGTAVSLSGHTHSYLPLSGGTITGNILGNQTAALGTTAAPFHNLVLGGATNNTMTASSTNPRITFCEGTGTQPVHLIYTDYDSYRAPAGLKIIGGSDATPAWLEVEGTIYAPTFSGALSGNASTATKLATARTISLTGSVTGSGSFDGSGNLSIATSRRMAFVGQSSNTSASLTTNN